MNKAKHTPGPWSVQVEPFDGIGMVDVVIASSRREVCFFSSSANERYLPDARLIASAPELLEALEGLLCWCQGYEADKLNPHAFSHMESARAAIAKATGEQP